MTIQPTHHATNQDAAPNALTQKTLQALESSPRMALFAVEDIAASGASAAQTTPLWTLVMKAAFAAQEPTTALKAAHKIFTAANTPENTATWLKAVKFVAATAPLTALDAIEHLHGTEYGYATATSKSATAYHLSALMVARIIVAQAANKRGNANLAYRATNAVLNNPWATPTQHAQAAKQWKIATLSVAENCCIQALDIAGNINLSAPFLPHAIVKDTLESITAIAEGRNDPFAARAAQQALAGLTAQNSAPAAMAKTPQTLKISG